MAFSHFFLICLLMIKGWWLMVDCCWEGEMPGGGIEPPRPNRARDFKSRASAYSATPASRKRILPHFNPNIKRNTGQSYFFLLDLRLKIL